MALNAQAQNKSDYTWVFGGDVNVDTAGIEGSLISFNSTRTIKYFPIPLQLGPTNASICNPQTGRLLFYTNGCAVADSTLQIMENGDDLNPGPLHDTWCDEGYDFPERNGALILNDPEYDKGYYLLHRIRDEDDGDEYGLFYSYVDMAGNNGKGIVTEKNVGILTDFDLLGGYLTACKHENSQDWWFILMAKDSNRYLVFLLDENGPNYHHDIFIGPQFSGFSNATGHASFSPDGSKYGWYNPFEGFHLFDFDRSTGMIGNFHYIEVPEYQGSNSEFYGSVAFSPSNQFAYLSSDFQLFQVDLWAQNFQESLTFIAEWDGFSDPLPNGLSSIGLGPDCKMYIASGAGVKHMGIIHQPDNPGMECDFRQHDLELPFHKGVGGVPNYPHYRIDEEAPCDPGITSSLSTMNNNQKDVKIFPNPSQNQIYFSFPTQKPALTELNILNAQGILIEELEIKNHQYSKSLEISHLPKSIYFYLWISEDKILQSGSFVKS